MTAIKTLGLILKDSPLYQCSTDTIEEFNKFLPILVDFLESVPQAKFYPSEETKDNYKTKLSSLCNYLILNYSDSLRFNRLAKELSDFLRYSLMTNKRELEESKRKESVKEDILSICRRNYLPTQKQNTTLAP